MKNRQHGTAAVEFALVLPIFLLILFGIIDFSLLLYDKAVITNAAREGARWASIHSSATSRCISSFSTDAIATPPVTDPRVVANSYAKDYLITIGAPFTPSTKCVSSGGLYSTGELETITTTYTYTGTGYLGSILSNAGLLTAVSSMYHE